MAGNHTHRLCRSVLADEDAHTDCARDLYLACEQWVSGIDAIDEFGGLCCEQISDRRCRDWNLPMAVKVCYSPTR
jgi:hypothetical protein